ncbi:hypothetical protein AX16_001396 [Volvariella volvacea WC 439]|nr:hypothetical protein AX16_001396 [Volvariella volvacea WC 439]
MSIPRASARRHASPRRARARSKQGDDKSTSPVPSPGSWHVDRGRSRVRKTSNPFSDENLRRRGYHSLLSSFGKVFHVEKRWKLIREMGSGAYGVVISAADEISGETVAIKLVTRVFDKVQLAKRALREITLLRHFANHENITGLIDVDAISPDFNEIPWKVLMHSDLHQIIKSGQTLTNEHVQYFLYQILRGMKYVHSASVIHRDLKPGNLLVNADCELKICDFGLSRGFDSRPDEYASHLTEYVATRWYRAPEIMLAFSRYTTAIDVWSIGCILAELLLVDQLNKVLDVLGTPDETVIQKIGSEKAQAYVRSLPYKKTIPFRKILPTADPLAIDLLEKMLTFDPAERITVPQALEHPWLAAYHDETDEPNCPEVFDKWKQIEQLETLEQFREALWNEIEDYRREVRGISIDLASLPRRVSAVRTDQVPTKGAAEQPKATDQEPAAVDTPAVVIDETTSPTLGPGVPHADDITQKLAAVALESQPKSQQPFSPEQRRSAVMTPTDPVVKCARRSSILQPSRQNSTFNSPVPAAQHLPAFVEGALHAEPAATALGPGSVAFPSQGYIVPARSRTGSVAGGGEATRKLLRTLSTVSIHESVEGLAGGLAGIAPIGRYIIEGGQTEADAPPSEMPRDFAFADKGERQPATKEPRFTLE